MASTVGCDEQTVCGIWDIRSKEFGRVGWDRAYSGKYMVRSLEGWDWIELIVGNCEQQWVNVDEGFKIPSTLRSAQESTIC